MCADSGYASLIQNDDLFRIHNGADPLGDQNHGCIFR